MTPETAEKHAVKDYLDLLGYFHFPLMAGFASYKGAPDRFAINHGMVIALEVKSPTGKLSPAEKQFQADWELHGGRYLFGTADQIINQLMRY